MMQSVRVSLAVLAVGLSVVAGAVPPALAQAAGGGKIDIATGGTGGPIQAFDAGWAKLINTKTPVQATVSVSGGSIENIRMLGRRKTDVGDTDTAGLGQAFRGEGPWQGAPMASAFEEDAIKRFTESHHGWFRREIPAGTSQQQANGQGQVAVPTVATTALRGVITPVHAGALRYDREKGLTVPADVLPPEAR
jgi:TRAP-type uncharacterized transport system substrate-binding protein